MQTDIDTTTDPIAAIDTPASTPDLIDVQRVGTTTPPALHANNASTSDVLIEDGVDGIESLDVDDYTTDAQPQTGAPSMAELRDSATSLAEDWLGTARGFIRERPVASLGTALAVGWIVAKLGRD